MGEPELIEDGDIRPALTILRERRRAELSRARARARRRREIALRVLIGIVCAGIGATIMAVRGSRETDRLRERLRETYERWHFEWRER